MYIYIYMYMYIYIYIYIYNVYMYIYIIINIYIYIYRERERKRERERWRARGRYARLPRAAAEVGEAPRRAPGPSARLGVPQQGLFNNMYVCVHISIRICVLCIYVYLSESAHIGLNNNSLKCLNSEVVPSWGLLPDFVSVLSVYIYIYIYMCVSASLSL